MCCSLHGFNQNEGDTLLVGVFRPYRAVQYCQMNIRESWSQIHTLPIITHTDKSVIIWNLTREEMNYGVAKKALHGHNHFVSDVVISSDGQFALSGSWDNTLRLWDLST